MFLIFIITQNLFMLMLEMELSAKKRHYEMKGKCSAQHRSENPAYRCAKSKHLHEEEEEIERASDRSSETQKRRTKTAR